MKMPFPFPLSLDAITAQRAEIYHALAQHYPNFLQNKKNVLPETFLKNLLRAYDRAFLQSTIRTLLPHLCVTASKRMTSCAGKFIVMTRKAEVLRCEIRMSTDFLFRLKDGPFSLNGLQAQDALEAFLLVFEHELCHALLYALSGTPQGHTAAFRALTHGLFGHTAIRHALPTRTLEVYRACGLRVGDAVSFSREDKVYSGFVSHIGKRISVMVKSPNGDYADRRGIRYDKYYVPLAQIKVLPR